MRQRRVLGTLLGVALVWGGLVAVPPPAQAAPGSGPAPVEQRSQSTATADSLPTVQIDNGMVWSQAIVGTTVYAGGRFSQTRAPGAAPGSPTTPRSNLLAYDLVTGALIDSFAPQVNGTIKVVRSSPDGSRIYIGGSFTQVDGQPRYNLAAFDTATGALVTNFKPAVGGSHVDALAVSSTTVYVGGLFTQVANVKRTNLAAVTTGGALTAWAPATNHQVDTMVFSPAGNVVVGGRFSTVNGSTSLGMASLDATSGTTRSWAVNNAIHNGTAPTYDGSGAGIMGLSTDGTAIYGTAWSYNRRADGDFEGAFSLDPSTGAINWMEDCHGDTYGGYSDGTTYYTVGHAHACSSVGGFPETSHGSAPDKYRQHHYAMAFSAQAKGTLAHTNDTTYWTDRYGQPAPAIVDWFPDFIVGTAASGGSGSGQAGWDVQGSGDYVVLGGEFQGVNNKWQQGLARFGRSTVATKTQGPRLNTATWAAPSASGRAGGATVSIPANWDRDDMSLTYELYRSGTRDAVARRTVDSTFWNLPTVSLVDSTSNAGASVSYTVRVVDGDGNAVTSQASNTITVPGGGVAPASGYTETVLADGPVLYWPLGGPSNSAAIDRVGSNNGNVGSGVSSAPTGAITGDAGTGSRFSGNSSGIIGASAKSPQPGAFSLEVWVSTTTQRGGKLIGFSGYTPGTAGGPNDRVVFMRDDGRLTFAVWPNTIKTVTSPNAYNDGRWHHVVATQGPAGMTLYVDGAQVAADASVTSAESTDGYWQVGGGYLGAWPSAPSSSYLAGDLDEAAVYGTVLSATQVAQHVASARNQTPVDPNPGGNPNPGGDPAPGVAPATFTTSTNGLTVTVNAAGSTGPGGTIAQYTWNFGDTASGVGMSTTHTYAAAGTYAVRLLVLDSAGNLVMAERTVTVSG